MSYGIKLHVWGDYACFTRPEMKAERVSYDLITPSAARGLVEAVYWKPQIRWVIDRIHVLKPVQFTNVRRNEVSAKVTVKGNTGVTAAIAEGRGNLGIYIEDSRQQRAAMILTNVAYVIEVHFDILEYRFERNGPELSANDVAGKHLDMFIRRVRGGQYFSHPYLGCREFPASFALVEDELPASELPPDQRDKDFGFILHDIAFDQDPRTKKVRSATPRFFRAEMRNGVVEVPPFSQAIA